MDVPDPTESRATFSATSASLVERLKADDPAAWERLVELYGPLVYAWCRRAGLQAADASDVTQEVFQAVAGAIDRFRRERPGDTFRGWLRVIARNKVRDHFRRNGEEVAATGGSEAHRRLEEIADDESELASGSGALGDLYARAVGLIRTEFAENTWRAFWRTTVDGCPASEVADELGLSPGAVRQAKYKVLRRLREELGDVEA